MDDYRQSDEYCQYFYQRGWFVEYIGVTRVLIKHIPFIGSIIKIQRGDPNISLKGIDVLAKKHKVLMVTIEPDITTEDPKYSQFEILLKEHGYSDINIFLSPTKTTLIDINKHSLDIINGFDGNIRKSINKNYSKNIFYEEITDIERFYKILQEADHRRNIFTQKHKDWLDKWKPFKNQLKIILAYHDGTLLGANMFTVKPPVGYGLFLPTFPIGKRNKIAASLIIEAIKVAKNHGCILFDLNGLFDSRYNLPKNWEGLSEFKKKFHGHEIEFMHPKVKLYSPFLKPLERLGILWMFYGDC